MYRAGFFKRAALSIVALAQLSAVGCAQEAALSTTISRSTITGSSSATATVTSTGTPTSSTTSSTSSSKASGKPTVHKVLVGSGGFKFTPNKLENVAVGDIIAFDFFPLDHSVARAEYGSPCVPYEDTGKGKVGFYSDVQWVRTVNDITHWNLTINSTEPIFFYCTAKGSCMDQQMVGVINPNATQTIEEQIAAAKNSTLELAPGQPIPAEHSGTLSPPSSSPTAASSTSTSAPDADQDSHPHTLSKTAIAGIVVGALSFLFLCAALFFFVGRSRSLKEHIERKDATITKMPDTPGTPGTFGPHSPYGAHPSNPYAYAPMSPSDHQGGFTPMGSPLPSYQQAGVADARSSVWQGAHAQPSAAEKPIQHYELASPTPQQQQSFVAELPASTKSPR
jgi:plastocyanin